MLTPNQVLELSEPVEQMYMDCSSQLIINIAFHFQTGRGLSTQDWQMRKLAELGQLNRESIAIISQSTGQRETEIRRAFESAVGMTLDDMEKRLQRAAAAGKIQAAAGDIFASERVRSVVQNYTAQAADDLNLVNTVMLNSTAARYRAAILQVVSWEEKQRIEALTSAANAAELATQLGGAQRILNQAAGSVAIPTATRTEALRLAVRQLAARGITGFVDRGGHQWSPEAYVNMDVRTTVHNVALQSQRARSADYGVDTFQVSTKAAARPLCAPYQGWICSWNNQAGVVEDLNGNKYTVHPINSTSYGEPAGLFGINCGHSAETFIPGFSVPRYEPLNAEELKKNEQAYKISQGQRELERQVRQYKTEAAAYNAAGDKEAFDKAALKVKQKTAEYKAFCAENNRTPRLDRTQVFGYNRSVSGKVTASARAQANRAIVSNLQIKKHLQL